LVGQPMPWSNKVRRL
jgi:hypothetical protein